VRLPAPGGSPEAPNPQRRPEGLSAGQIDAEVRRLSGEGRHLYELDEPTLAELDVDLIVTQAVCEGLRRLL
jgi:hypothetical protein